MLNGFAGTKRRTTERGADGNLENLQNENAERLGELTPEPPLNHKGGVISHAI